MHSGVAFVANQKTRDATKQSLIQAIKRLKNKTPIFAEKDAELNFKNIAIESRIKKSKIGTYMDTDVKKILSKAVKHREAEKRLIDTLNFLLSSGSDELKGKQSITQAYVCSLVGIKNLNQFGDEIRDQVIEKTNKAEAIRIKNLLSYTITQAEKKVQELDLAVLLKSIGYKKLDDLKDTEFEEYFHRIKTHKIVELAIQEQNIPKFEKALQRIIDGQTHIVETSIHTPITKSMVSIEAGYSHNYLNTKKEPYLKLCNKITSEEKIRKEKGELLFLVGIENQLIQAFDLIASKSLKLSGNYSLTMYGVAEVAQDYCGVPRANQYGKLDYLIAKHSKDLHQLRLKFDEVAYYQGLSTKQQWSLLNKAYAKYFEKISNLDLNRSLIDFGSLGAEISEYPCFIAALRMHLNFAPLPMPKYYARLLEDRMQDDKRRSVIAQCFKALDLLVVKGETPSLHKIHNFMGASFSFKALNESAFYQLLQIKVRRLRLLSNVSLAINPEDSYLRLIDALQRLIEKNPTHVSLVGKTSLDELAVLQEAGFESDSLEIQQIRNRSTYRTILKITALLNDDIQETYLLEKYFELKKIKLEQYPILTNENWRNRKVYLNELADLVGLNVEMLEKKQKLLDCFMKIEQDYL